MNKSELALGKKNTFQLICTAKKEKEKKEKKKNLNHTIVCKQKHSFQVQYNPGIKMMNFLFFQKKKKKKKAFT